MLEYDQLNLKQKLQVEVNYSRPKKPWNYLYAANDSGDVVRRRVKETTPRRPHEARGSMATNACAGA